ncbi:MAG: phosphonate metabolism protein/1,5-bisphosphokinase (PRPP-forming) PhnN [Pseudomonadota bacterium]|nr:phosphonate metabolism protein/1,5-bisphosphokinase (PRPP-forming) PhnN [Pseudomonadota bacterium]
MSVEFLQKNANSKPSRPGQLFYVIGPSGVGKDSLLNYARQQLGTAPVIFAHRYITRPPELQGENHIYLSETEFNNRLQRGCFKFDWSSHGWQYALGNEVDMWLQQGLNVVMNGSRGYLAEASRRHPEIIPVLITASEVNLRQRLIRRGRETAKGIEERIQRARAFSNLKHSNLVVIENDSTIEQAGDQLVSILWIQVGDE